MASTLSESLAALLGLNRAVQTSMDPGVTPLGAPRPRTSTPAQGLSTEELPGSTPPTMRPDAIVRRVCLAVPPAWPLDSLVATHPFIGLDHLHPVDAHAVLERRLHAPVLPEPALWRPLFERGAFNAEDVRWAVEELRRRGPQHAVARGLEAEALLGLLAGTAPAHPFAPERVLSMAARLDEELGTAFAPAIVADLSKLLATRMDRGVARWAQPLGEDDPGLYTLWWRYACRSLNLEARGVKGFRRWVRALPSTWEAALDSLLPRTTLTGEALEDYLARLLGELQGWAGLLRGEAWSGDHDDPGAVPQLLTARLACDVAVRELLGGRAPGGVLLPQVPPREPPMGPSAQDGLSRFALQLAAEHGFVRRLLPTLAPARTGGVAVHLNLARASRPAVQAMFCIDVRSEPVRRHLEAVAADVETCGFAGFFGLPLAVARPGEENALAHCPVLLDPAHRVQVGEAPRGSWAADVKAVLGAVRRAAVSAFTTVETLGFAAAVPMLAETFGRAGTETSVEPPLDVSSLSSETRLALASKLVDVLPLARPWARIVLLCGHDSTLRNNPQAAALACGACAGHGGGTNARVAAALLNDAEVRAGLAQRGTPLPEDCVVVPACHDTATDEIRLLDVERIPASHREDVERLMDSLKQATAASRAARVAALPGVDAGEEPLEAARLRSRHWAETRPEWGLANNAAFVVAPRSRTRGRDLGGRCFLHDYRAELDADGSVLKLILTAPVVVATWINLQYSASTVAASVLGSGTKTLHNVVGGVGVLLGNEGDLAMGLSHQSVHDGTAPRHEPLRLQVFVEADRQRIHDIIKESPALGWLVNQEWIVLYALGPEGRDVHRYARGLWLREESDLRATLLM